MVLADVTEVAPAVFDAVTTTRNVAPTSKNPSPRSSSVAPGRLKHDAPEELQRRHW